MPAPRSGDWCTACNRRWGMSGHIGVDGLCDYCRAPGGMPFQGDPCPVCRWPIGGWIAGDWYRCHHCHSDVNVVTREARTDEPAPSRKWASR